MSAVKKLIVDELYKPARKNFNRRRTIVKCIDDIWQLDLAEFPQHARENKGCKFILVVIDCFSKFLWTRALKSKSADDVSKAMADVLRESGRHPAHLQSDQGKEFFNTKFNTLIKKYGINHYNTYTVMKASMAERVIRTLKEKLHKMFNLRGQYKWIDVLQDVTDTYNNTVHRTTRMRPSEVNKKNEKALLMSCYGIDKKQTRAKLLFGDGDIVRISKEKTFFEKGYTPRWSTELFRVVSVQTTHQPPTYLLEDLQGNPISGCFYAEELQKTNHPDIYLVEKVLKRKGSRLYVQWLGIKERSWIDSKDIK